MTAYDRSLSPPDTMQTYKVRVTVTQTSTVTVEAQDDIEALMIAKHTAYRTMPDDENVEAYVVGR